MEFTKKDFELFRQGFEMVVKNLETVFNVKIKAGNIKYLDSTFTMKVEVTKANATPQTIVNYQKYAGFEGLPALGTKFQWLGKTYEIVGYDPKRRKKPVMLKNAFGKQLICPTDLVKMALKK